MANGFYAQFKDELGQGNIDLLTDTIKVLLVDTDYTVDLASHEDLADIAAGARVGTAQTLGTKTLTDGTFDAADVTFPTITNTEDIDSVVLYKDTGVEATSTLIAYWDTDTGGAIALTTNGGDVNLTWDSGADKVFSL